MFQAFSVGMEFTSDVNILLLVSLVSSNRSDIIFFPNPQFELRFRRAARQQERDEGGHPVPPGLCELAVG